MMDPFSIIGAVAAAAQLAGSTANIGLSLYRFYCEVKNAPEKSKELCDEIYDLSTVINDLAQILKEVDKRTDVIAIDIISIDSLQKYYQFLDDLSSRIKVNEKGFKKKFKWPFSIKDNLELMAKVGRHKSTFMLALETANLSLGSAHSRTKLERVDKGVIQIITDLKHQEDIANNQRINAERQQIVNWLKVCDPSFNHVAARKIHEPGTGSWFIDSTEFVEWRDNQTRTLWLQGIPGAGKTILCSTIIEEIQKFCENQLGHHCAYFYFDFSDKKKQTVNSFLRSIIIQLFVDRPDIPDEVQSLYDDLRVIQPRHNSLIKTLLSLLKTDCRTYIIIDALDECCERDEMANLIEYLISSSSSIKLLITSRMNQDIISELQPHIEVVRCIQGEKVDSDIEVYVRKRLDKDRKLRRCRPIQNEVIKALVEGANGMFQWVVCQLDALQKCLTPEEIKATLSKLPKTLDETYIRILDSIDDSHLHYVHDVLTLICFSIRPLSLREIVEAIAFDKEDKRFTEHRKLTDPMDVLEICCGLVSLSVNQPFVGEVGVGEKDLLKVCEQEVRFAHFSVKEFLTDNRSSGTRFHISIQDANRLIAERCLVYLLSNLSAEDFSIEILIQPFPFLRYSARYWYDHISSLPMNPIHEWLRDRIIELFHSTGDRFSNWLRIWDPDREAEMSTGGSRPNELYYSSLLGLFDVTDTLLGYGADPNAQGGYYGNALQAASGRGHESIVLLLLNNGAKVNSEGGYFRRALQAASINGHEAVVRLLLSKGADINSQDRHGSALQAASGKGYVAVVRLLLNEVADVKALDRYYGSALHAASCNGHEAVVRLLLSAGADVNALCLINGTALERASAHGHEAVVRLLLSNGADVNKSGHYDSALLAASLNGNEAVVRLLLSKGANTNTQCGFYGTALQAASLTGNEAVVQMLLKNGAHINTECGFHHTALQAASLKGHEGVVRLLLSKNADINIQGGEHGNALQAASYGGRENVVRLLLDNGVDVNMQGGKYGNALQAASYNGHLAVVQLLLAHGAEANLQGGQYGNALQAASYNGCETVVQLLLDNGAEVNIQGGEYGNSLHAASLSGNETVVQLLLSEKADANAQGGMLGNALQAASLNGHKNVILLLLGESADINAQGGRYGNALQTASLNGHEAVVRLLLRRGAEVNLQGGEYDTALQAASYNGHEGVVCLLLSEGADVNAQGELFRNALHSASYGGKESVARILLSAGADINTRDSDGSGILLTAAIRGHEAVVRLLLENGADVDAQGGTFGNALQMASVNGHEAVVRLLLKKGANVNARGGYHGDALQGASLYGHETVVRLLLSAGADVNAKGGQHGTALQAALHNSHEGVVRLLQSEGAGDRF